MARIARMWVLAGALVVGACRTAGTADVENPPPLAGYSGGPCPTLVEGENTFVSSGIERRLFMTVPRDFVNAPVMFVWHPLGFEPMETLFATGLYELPGVIVVAPAAIGSEPFIWQLTLGPENNPDLIFFDDLLTCLDQEFNVDLDRIWTTGISAGALWSAFLLQHRSLTLASAALLSGGEPDPSVAPPYQTPERNIPVLLAWGGPSDTFQVPGQNFVYNNGEDPSIFSFHAASLALAAKLRNDGHAVVRCPGNYGHLGPPDPFALIWPFLRDHPRSGLPEPWSFGLPPDASPSCLPP